MNDQPVSKMIRVPTPLVTYVNELSRLYRQGKTKPLLQQLQQLIAALDSTSDTQPNNLGHNIDSSLIAKLVQSVKHIESILEQTTSTTASTTASKHAIIKTDSPGAETFSLDTATDSKLDSNLGKPLGLTVAELAKELGISERQVYRLRQANQLAGWKTINGKGKALRYIPADEG